VVRPFGRRASPFIGKDMKVRSPHFLLFSGTCHSGYEEPDEPDRWRFVLESVNGDGTFEASDAEPGVARERLELLSLVRGLEALDQPSRVTLVTPSRYITSGMRYGMPEWRENKWRWERFGQQVPVKNADLWKRVDRALYYHDVDCKFWRLDGSHQISSGDSSRPRRRRSKRRASSGPLQSASSSLSFWGSLSGLVRGWQSNQVHELPGE